MKFFIIVLLSSVSYSASAVWVNTTGNINSIVNYAHRDTILVSLSSTGSVVSECSDHTVFAVGHSYLPERRARMYAMLLAAQASDRRITVSYNDAGNCEPWDNSPSVYRLISRLTL